MSKNLYLPDNYHSVLNLKKTEEAIKFVKDSFQRELTQALNLNRVSAPIIVLEGTGVNDYLSGKEIPVQFQIDDLDATGEIVQSLAKWKRQALSYYGFKNGEGLYTDMNAIRPHETLDNLHSLYVDQWDWERVMTEEDRNLDFLKMIIRKIYDAIRNTEALVYENYPELQEPFLPKNIHFVHSEELQAMFPDLAPREREDIVCREHGAVFVIGIGATLQDGQPHDLRASDYDDWITETTQGYQGLNGDILIWYPVLNRGLELSSMGIRVNKEALLKQLEAKNETYKMEMDFHQKLLNGKLHQTVGGGIGQSRICMLYLRKAHIGEVQACIWTEEMKQTCKENNIFLL